MTKIKRAIMSVTDKSGIAEFGQFLQTQGVEILSTGGTAKVLREAGVDVVDVAEFTGSPEILDGRLKTLHPKIEGGILGIRNNSQHQSEMKDNDILPIDLVVVNLYAFENTVAKDGVTLEDAIENIDIGGPTMIRAAAKNYQDVSVVVDPSDYSRLTDEIKESGEVSAKTNFELAVKVFQKTASYDTAISHYLTSKLTNGTSYPTSKTIQLTKKQDLRYGENPHQKAALYSEVGASEGSVVHAKQLHGKELSFNNYIDLEGALSAVRAFKDPACVIVKHTNPCGVALGASMGEAFERAKEADPVSCFGGIIGLNREVDEEVANQIGETFFECIIAPSFSAAALDRLTQKKNLRLMTLENMDKPLAGLDYKRVSGGVLVQESDTVLKDLLECEVPTERKPSEDEYAELGFAWTVVKYVKSNAIVFTKDRQTLGVGAGQMSRVDSVNIAAMKAPKSLQGAVMASDAFFPFRDGVDRAAKQGITAIVQPGGSVRDEEVIQAANEHGIAMVFTGMRHFRH